MKHKNLFVILAILIVPVILFYTIGPRAADQESTNLGFAASCTKPVVYDFSSPMCLECQTLKKVMTPLENEYKDKVTFNKINVNSNDANTQKLVKKYNVVVVPTLVFVDRNGKVIRRTEGSMPREELKKYLDELNNG